ncbi:hypothetical protein EXV95_18770 [Acidovorax sp. JMULE5]|uniref:patatin-like phospholipase family protein n=1 Tax=Acidovorax sp. JMULE5 TaxID=2518343 RepID=UPI0015A3DDC8|nr:patatin-like phospholipase family protein [Acidovorax sp. JMULE5]QLA82501.1 hypothetical protein EXV95_18770 [Acidovorax sp. JMULE5]
MSDVPSQPQTSPAEPLHDVALDADLKTLVTRRRELLADDQRPAVDAGTWGLALSGGGIRSATFCFGLIKALAKNQVFHRFDMLSTVSGGGYIGATVGRLFHDAARIGQPAQEVEAALADADTRWFAFWLRANGRYLIPRSGKDLMFAAANFGRNLVGVHIEVALLCLLLGSLLVQLDLGLWQWADCLTRKTCAGPSWLTADVLGALSRWPSLWLLMPPLMLVAAALASAYWVLPSKAREDLSLLRWLMVALCLAGCWELVNYWQARPANATKNGALQLPSGLLLAAGGVLLAWVAGALIAQGLARRYPDSPDVSRNRLTTGLAHVLKAGLAILVLGLVDMLAWLLADADGEHQGALGAASMLTVVALRAVLPKIADLPRSLTPGTRINLSSLVNFIGLSVLLLVLVFWISVVHRVATLALFDETLGSLHFRLSWFWLSVITLPVALLMGVSLRNRDFLNRSSLYAFYRARLVRAYLGAGNVARFGGHPQAATAVYQRDDIARPGRVSVQDVHASDDVAMASYAPHAGGGPVHLINACVNQTRDTRGGLFNQDRKGLPITAGPQGWLRIGDDGWSAGKGAEDMTLGSWMAISGAAVAPGLGSSTKPGIASLLTLCGIRLGYWWNVRTLQWGAGASAPRCVGKYNQLLAELQGSFDGTDRADWYLSDGGHFENTAAYALLREECALVVVADCGADPRYAFGDLENLVRKARIDLQAQISFLKPRLPTTLTLFGSLNDLASDDSQACLAIARIDYRSGKKGYMIVVKPNMCAGVPVDLTNFKADHPLFPQEPTTDQLFSEAQWESYFHLGYTMGMHLQRQMLDDLPYVAATHFEFDDGSIATRDERGRLHVVAAPKRLPSRIAATGAVAASVSLGALATLGAATWQAVDKQMKKWEDARRVHPDVLKELSDLHSKYLLEAPRAVETPVDTPAPATTATVQAPHVGAKRTAVRPNELATALVRVAEAHCKPENAAAYRASLVVRNALADALESCRAAGSPNRACIVLLDKDDVPDCLRQDTSTRPRCERRYWVRDPSAPGPAQRNCLPQAPASSSDSDTSVQPEKVFSLLAVTLELLGLVTAKDPSPSTGAAVVPTPNASAASTPAPGTSASSAPTAATPGSVSAPMVNFKVCLRNIVYIQIFGPELRDRARLLREPWRKLGASVPPVEDVVDSARRRGRNAPQVPAVPTVIYHDSGSLACALRLQPPGSATPWAVRPLPPQLNGTPGTIEVWIPPMAEAGS